MKRLRVLSAITAAIGIAGVLIYLLPARAATCTTVVALSQLSTTDRTIADLLKQICENPAAGGGGSSDASAANQTSQITQETAINTVLGAQANSTWDGSAAASVTSILRYIGVKLEAIRVAITGTLTVSGPVTDAQLRASAVPISVATIPSHAVTNAGTFAVQAVLGAETTKVIGTVNQGTSPWVVSGAVTNAGTFATQITQWASTSLGVPTAYGTAPTTGNYLGVNAFVTNTNANGQATMANSSPVVIASNQASIPVASTAAAGELHIGEVGGNQIRVDVAQTVTASSAYTSGNAIGGKMTIAGAARVSGSLGAAGTGGLLQQVVMNSKSVQTAQVDVFIFNSDPSGSTCTDKTAFVLATADFDKVVGVASIPGTAANGSGWFSGGTGSVGQAMNLAMAYDLSSATSMYACAVVRGTPTFAATSDISFKYQFLRN